MSWRQRLYRSDYLMGAFLLFVAGYYLIPSSKWHNNLYYALVLAPFLLSYPWRGLAADLRSPPLALAFALLLSLDLSLSWSAGVAADDVRKILGQTLYVAAFLLLGMQLFRRYPDLAGRLFRVLGWVVLVAGIGSIIWYYQSHPFPQARLGAWGRLQHAGWASMLYGLVGLWCLLQLVEGSNTRPWPRRIWLWAVALTALTVMLLSQSRGPLAALLLTLLIAGLLSRNWRLLSGFVLLGLGLALLTLAGGFDPVAMLTREGGDSHRLEIWGQAWDQIRSSPWLGLGILAEPQFPTSNRQISPHPHNLLLSAWFYGGVPALLLFLALLLTTLWAGLKLWRRQRRIELLALTLYGLFYLMTDGYKFISSPWPNWLYYWLPIAWAAQVLAPPAADPADSRPAAHGSA